LTTAEQAQAREAVARFLENRARPPPGLCIKRIRGTAANRRIFEGRVNRDIRFTFEKLPDGTLEFRNVGHHDVIDSW